MVVAVVWEGEYTSEVGLQEECEGEASRTSQYRGGAWRTNGSVALP